MSRINDPAFLVRTRPLRSMNREKKPVESVKVKKDMLPHAQHEPIWDEFYLDLIRHLPSIVSGYGPCIAHHLRLPGHDGGTGMKPGDDQVVPMLDIEHTELHSVKVGDKRDWAFHGIDAGLCAAWLWSLYTAGAWNYAQAVYVIKQCQPKEGV